MFLRMCDTSCHEEIIAELQGVEWPVGYGKRLRVEFNRNYTLPHQLLARERFLQVNSATQTDPDIAATNANTHRIFGSSSSLSTFCFWDPEEFLEDDKYTIVANDDDTWTLLENENSPKKQYKITSNGSVKQMRARLVINQRKQK